MNEELKQQVLHQLGTGKHKAIPGRVLAQRLGFDEDAPNTRAIRLAIVELIKEGHPIIGRNQEPKGYYIADNIPEIKEQMEILRGYIIELAKHRRDLKLCIRTIQKEKQLALI